LCVFKNVSRSAVETSSGESALNNACAFNVVHKFAFAYSAAYRCRERERERERSLRGEREMDGGGEVRGEGIFEAT
jgi:hypothetical protein